MANVNSTRWPPHSMADLARPWNGRHLPRRSITYYPTLNQLALRRLLEPKLAALVGVEDLRLAVLGDRLFDDLRAERRVHRDRQAPRQHAPAVPVDHGRQVDEAARHRDVGDVHRPDVVRTRDRQHAQQVRVDRVPWRLLARVGLAVQRRDAHAPHQRGHVLAADREALGSHQVSQHARAGERQFEVQFVDAPHQLEVRVTDGLRLVVNRAAANVHDRRLARDRQGVGAVDHRFVLSMPALMSAPSKKSFSSASCPILACSTFRSTVGSSGRGSPPNTSAALANNWLFQSVIWLGCTSCCCASSASVLSPRTAASATLALNAAECVRRGLLLMLAPVPVSYTHLRAHETDSYLVCP